MCCKLVARLKCYPIPLDLFRIRRFLNVHRRLSAIPKKSVEFSRFRIWTLTTTRSSLNRDWRWKNQSCRIWTGFPPHRYHHSQWRRWCVRPLSSSINHYDIIRIYLLLYYTFWKSLLNFVILLFEYKVSYNYVTQI